MGARNMHDQDTIPTKDNVLFYLKFKGNTFEFHRFVKKFMNQMMHRLMNPLTEEDERLSDLFEDTELQIYGMVNGRPVNTIVIVRPDDKR